MKPLCVCFFLVALALLGGCSGRGGYTRFRSTNLRGENLAEWTARGSYYPVSGGYRITAVERISGPPYQHLSRYPLGWRTTISGPNIEHWRTGKPLWMEDGEAGFEQGVGTGKEQLALAAPPL